MSNDKHDEAISSNTIPSTSYSRSQSLVFISHDTRDAELAEAFSRLLTSVSAGVLKSFRSSDRKGSQGIEYGVEWYPAIMTKLDIASDVVCLLTRRSVNRPWILYEAGVARGKLGATVLGLALGIPLSAASTGPFAQFQNSNDDVDSITKLVLQLLARVPNSEPDYAAVQLQVLAFKETSDEILKRLDEEDTSIEEVQQVGSESVAKLFEEVKVMFDDLPSRIDSKIASVVPSPSPSKQRTINPRILSDFIYITRGVTPERTVWLVAISQFRENIPWLYESGLEVYRALNDGQPVILNRAVDEFRSILRFTFMSDEGEILRGAGVVSTETARYGYEYVKILEDILDSLIRPMSSGGVLSEEVPSIQRTQLKRE